MRLRDKDDTQVADGVRQAQGRTVERIGNSILFTGGDHGALIDRFLDSQAVKREARQSRPKDKGAA